MHNFKEYLCDKIIKNDIESEDMKEQLVYGLQILYGKILSYSFFLLFTIFSGKYIQGLLFLIVFLNIRKYTGGFHFENEKICFVFSMILYCIILNISFSNEFNLFELQICTILPLIIIFALAPLNHPNLALSKYEIFISEKFIRKIIVFVFIICQIWIFSHLYIKYVKYILLGLLINAMMLILGKLKERRET